jgi:hypothetical protein
MVSLATGRSSATLPLALRSRQQRALPLSHGWVRPKDETKHVSLLRYSRLRLATSPGVTRPVLTAKVPDHVIGDRRKLGIRIGWAEWRHVDVLAFDAVLRAVQHDLSYITAVGIGHRSAADQRGIARLPALAVILMAVYASTFENVTAEFVLRLLRTRCRRGVDLVITFLRCNRAQISDKSADVLRRQILQTVLDRFCHRPGGGTAILRVGGGEIAGKLRIGPIADARAFVGCDIIGESALQNLAGEFAAAFQPVGQTARRVTLATMAERGGQISAAIDRGRLCGIGYEAPVAQEE